MATIQYIDPTTSPIWPALLERYHSSIFHSPDWLTVLKETYGMEIGAYVLMDDADQPVAGIPLAHICDMRGERLVSLPFCDYCDPLVTTEDQWRSLFGAIDSRHMPVIMRPLHNPLPVDDPRFSEMKVARWHRIDLSPGTDILWQNIDRSAHRAIHKAQQANVQVRLAEDKCDLRQFFEMHLHVRKHKYHMMAQPYRFFEHIWDHFIEPRNGMLLMACKDDQVLGATLFLIWKQTLYYKFNASNAETLNLRPNDLIIWSAIQWAKAQGLDWLDFGLSDWDQEGLIRFKRKFNPEEKVIHFLSYTNGSSDVPWKATYGQVLSQLTDLLTAPDTPDTITEGGGDILYRLFA